VSVPGFIGYTSMVKRARTITAFPLFEDPPQVELLQWLARGSLKQNLLRAIRLWVWIESLYGETQIELSDPFTYAQWRDAFFSATHPTGEAIPKDHDVKCTCAKTTSQWLFTPQTGLSVKTWRQSLQQYVSIPDEQLQQWLQKRLFAVTRRSLFADLQILTELGWLTSDGTSYYRVQQFPNRPFTQEWNTADPLGLPDLGFLNPNLETIAQSLSQPIADVQRFYLEVDYIIAQTQRQVEQWLETLKTLWESAIVPPVKLVYRSAKFGTVECIIYPVCIYYVQRAIYLCGFGQPPSQQGEWYNYRLDKIEQMTVLQWQDATISPVLRHRQQNLPTPDYISTQMRRAWGFDFYLPATLMLLRFERTFHDRYIQGTFRHQTFKPLSQAQVKRVIQDYGETKQRQALLDIVQSRAKQDAYYSVVYRAGDTNVELRLRAWRPNVEVLLPWALRQQVCREVAQEQGFYLK
jgi:CRISPR-associated protein (TIGR03985 family)